MPMLKKPCPNCGAKLKKLDEAAPDTSNVKWYRFVGPKLFCPSCKAELKLSKNYILLRILFGILAFAIYFYSTWSEREFTEKIIYMIVFAVLIISPGFIWPRETYVKKDK